MNHQCNYIMQDLADDPIPEIMRYRVTRNRRRSHGFFYYALSAATVTFAYLLAMAVAAN